MNFRTRAVQGALLTAAIASAVAPSLAQASLPYGAVPSNILAAAAADDLLKTSPLYLDNENAKVIYVGPASHKTQAGHFDFTDEVMDCGQLKTMYTNTYLMPAGDGEALRKIALRGPYSPYFDYVYGNTIRNNTTLSQIQTRAAQADSILEKNAKEVGEYTGAKDALDRAHNNVVERQAAVDALYRQRDQALALFSSATASNVDAARAQLTATQDELSKRLPQLLSDVAAARSAESDASLVLRNASANAAYALGMVKQLSDEATSIQAIYDLIDKNTAATFSRSEQTLAKTSQRPVGRASASYRVYDNEQTELQKILPDTSYSVARLSIVNVRIKDAPTTTELKRAIGHTEDGLTPALTTIEHVSAVAADLPTTTEDPKTSPLKSDKGLPLPIPMREPTDQASIFTTPISQGAYCMSAAKTSDELSLPKADTGTVTVSVPKYVQRQGSLMNQPVALNYQYFMKADPISVSCEMNISKFNSYSRSSGSQGSWFWKHSWDDTVRKQVSDNGVVCAVKTAPNGMTEQEQLTWKNELIQRMSQEIMAEYTLQFAAKWDLIGEKSVSIPTRGSTAVGASMMTLCQGNYYCQIANVVWKAADEIFGGAAGSTSSVDSVTGSIKRSYDEDSYRLEEGSTTIDIAINLDK